MSSAGATARARGPGRPRGGEQDGRTSLMLAAARQFAENGYAATNIRDILRVAGVTTPTMYHYFCSKADLYITVVKAGVDELHDRMRDAGATQGGTLAEDFDAILAGIDQVYRTHPYLIDLLLGVEAAVRAHVELAELEDVDSTLLDFWRTLGGRVLSDSALAAFRGLVEGYIRLGRQARDLAAYDGSQRIYREILKAGLAGHPAFIPG
jgi:AcrR family transcriptional regulator